MVRIFHQYVSPKALLLIATESVLIALAVLCAVRVRFWNDPASFEFAVAWPDFALQTALIVATFQTCFYYNDLYDLNIVRTRGEQMARLGQSLGAACLLLGLLYFLAPGLLIGRGVFFLGMLFVAVWLLVARSALDRAWQAAGSAQNILILGTGERALKVARELSRRDDLNVRLAGFAGEVGNGQAVNGAPILGPHAEVARIAAEHKVARIIVAVEDRRGVLPVRDLVRLRVEGVAVEEAHATITALTGRVPLEAVPPSWFVFTDGFRRSKATRAAKRAIDLFFASFGLLLSAPLMLAIAAAVRLDSKGPAIYRQERVGWKGRTFYVLKFRSMRLDAERAGAQWAASRDPRVTRIGGILRKFRLDELPQFLNVIRGEMSFVGPRPERPVFVDELRKRIPYYDERHSVRPGLTGWAQVQYPYGASVEDAMRKLEYDLFYLKNMSVPFDCAIVFETIRTVLFGKGR